MAVTNHIDKYDLDADVKLFYQEAAMYLLYGLLAEDKPNIEYQTYTTGNTRYREWWKLTQNRIIGPTAVPFAHANIADIDPYIFDVDDNYNHIISDFILLNYDARLCILSLSNYDEVIVDMLASSIANMQREQIQHGYAYLSFVQQLATLTNEKSILDKTHSQQYDGATMSPEDI